VEALTIRRAERAEIARAASSLALAFEADPVCAFVWPNDATRRRQAGRSFAAGINALWRRREVHVDPSFSSVAVWARPGEWEAPPAAVIRMIPASIRNRVTPRSFRAFLRTDALHPKEPHWYLEYLGTVPSHQGQGLGGKVLGPVLARADEEGVPVWAWSSNRMNLGFYHRHGFEVLDEVPFAPGGPTIFPIRREPRG
jgi:GNAT superfamily N-acetyltransferase